MATDTKKRSRQRKAADKTLRQSVTEGIDTAIDKTAGAVKQTATGVADSKVAQATKRGAQAVGATASNVTQGLRDSKVGQATKRGAEAVSATASNVAQGLRDKLPSVGDVVDTAKRGADTAKRGADTAKRGAEAVAKRGAEAVAAVTETPAERANRKVASGAQPSDIEVEALKRQRAKDTYVPPEVAPAQVNEGPDGAVKRTLRSGGRIAAPVGAAAVVSDIAEDISDKGFDRSLLEAGRGLRQGVADAADYGTGFLGREMGSFAAHPLKSTGEFITEDIPQGVADFGRGILSTADTAQAGLRAGVGQLFGEEDTFGNKIKQYRFAGNPSAFGEEFSKAYGAEQPGGVPVAPTQATQPIQGEVGTGVGAPAPTGLRAAQTDRAFIADEAQKFRTGLDVAQEAGVKFNRGDTGNIAAFNMMNKIAKAQNQANQLERETNINEAKASAEIKGLRAAALKNDRDAETEDFERMDKVRAETTDMLSKYDQLVQEGERFINDPTILQQADNIKQSAYDQALETAFNPKFASSAAAGQFIRRDVKPIMEGGFLSKIADAIDSNLVGASAVINNAGEVAFTPRALNAMRIRTDSDGERQVFVPIPTLDSAGNTVEEMVFAFSMDRVQDKDPRTAALLNAMIPAEEKRSLSTGVR